MADPDGFARRMQALALVPEPLWWLLGAVVAFYFGAREAHHARLGKFTPPPLPPQIARHSPRQPSAGRLESRSGPLTQEIFFLAAWVQPQFFQPVFQILGQMWHAQQVICCGRGCFRFGGGDGLGIFIGLECAAPDPSHGGQAGLFIRIQRIDKGMGLVLSDRAFAGQNR